MTSQWLWASTLGLIVWGTLTGLLTSPQLKGPGPSSTRRQRLAIGAGVLLTLAMFVRLQALLPDAEGDIDRFVQRASGVFFTWFGLVVGIFQALMTGYSRRTRLAVNVGLVLLGVLTLVFGRVRLGTDFVNRDVVEIFAVGIVFSLFCTWVSSEPGGSPPRSDRQSR